MSNLSDMMLTISIWTLPVLLAVTLHEAGHAYMAYRCGDDTAARAGRLSFNPLVHVDPFGTVLLPLLLIFMQTGFVFGYARPVPVYRSRLKNLPRDSILVSLAGPGANVLIALVSSFFLVLAMKFGVDRDGWLMQVLAVCVGFNCILAVFNMIPVPPLDGGRILVDLLPYNAAQAFSQIERFGIFIVLAIVLLVPGLVWGMADGLAGLLFGLWAGVLL